jgi:pimeloyl-ACP methyl ester carboxylesterase
MATFLLLHGGMHGAWCWDHLRRCLEAAGKRVVAPDMPGHGADTTPRAQVTMESYIERVLDTLKRETEPAFVVAHSMAGAYASGAAEVAPERFKRLVYISAIVPESGQSMNTAADRAARAASAVEQAMVEVEPGISHLMKQDIARVAFYNDCTDEQAAWALARLTPQPHQPIRDPVTLSAAGFGKVPKAYIRCNRDAIVPPERQDLYAARAAGALRYTIDTGHSPFLNQPERLAEMLIEIDALP